MLNGFGTVVNALGKRVKPYLPQICGTVLWRLNNKSAKVRQQAADLISRTAVVMKTCQEVRGALCTFMDWLNKNTDTACLLIYILLLYFLVGKADGPFGCGVV